MAELVVQPAADAAVITALVNQKGGVGKTTTAVNLARALAKFGRRVLLVDVDGQAASTFHFLGVAGETLASLYNVIGSKPDAERVNLAEAIVMTEVEGIWVMPANEDLALLGTDLVVAGIGRESRLAKAIADVARDYDDILLDCPPSLDLLTVNALVAAHQALVITQPELFSARGVDKLLDTIDDVRGHHLNPSLRIVGVLINGYDGSEEIHVERAEQIRTEFAASDPPIPVLPMIVPRWTTILRTTDTSAGAGDFNHPWARRAAGIYENIARIVDPGVPALEEASR